MARADIPPETVAIGVDVGGTETLVGVVNDQGRVIAEHRFETPAESVEAVATIAAACRVIAAEAGIAIERVGIGAPGPLELSKGIIELAPNLGWERVPLKAMFTEELGCEVWLDNDANAAALGEAWIGAGRQAKVLLMVTLGTGIGGGLVADGRLFHGAAGRALEIGHQVVEPGGRECACGRRGCVEAYFSGRALAEQAVTAGHGEVPSLPNLFRAYSDGDESVVPWMDHAIDALALGVAQAVILFDPDQVTFTGGLAGSWDAFGARLRAGIEANVGSLGPHPSFELSTLDGRAGVIGAARLALGGTR
jgi:glucokinase